MRHGFNICPCPLISEARNGSRWIAVEAGKLAELPVMVDFGRFRPERPYEELVTSRLRPGDISTHMYIDFIHMPTLAERCVLIYLKPRNGVSFLTWDTVAATLFSIRRCPPSARVFCQILFLPTCTSPV